MERAQEMVEACRGALVMVTMAPEADGVDEVARFFFDQGVVCSAGHTAAHYRDGVLAIGLGFRTLTHAFNAMPPLDHRDPSILASFIQESRTTVQLICDGYHVSPPMVDLLYRTLHDRLVLATDNMPPAGRGYRIEGGVVRAEDGTIAGSALLMDQAVRNLMSYADIPFADRGGQRHPQPGAAARHRPRARHDRGRQARRPLGLERRAPGALDHRRRPHRLRRGPPVPLARQRLETTNSHIALRQGQRGSTESFFQFP